MVQGVLSFLGQEALYEKQQMAAEIVSQSFFAWPEVALEGARDIYIETKTTIDLSGTTNVAAIRAHMQALDAVRGAVEIAKLYIPTGWDLTILMYPNLESSVANVALDLTVNVASLLEPTGLISTTAFIIDVGKLRINLKAIEKILLQLNSLQLDFRRSPFDTFPAVNSNVTPVLTVPSASYVVDKDSGWVRLRGLSVSDADNDSLNLVVAVAHGQLRATGAMVVRLNVSDTDFEDAIRFNRSSPSSINTALATLEYRPPQNWEEGRDFILLWLTDNRVQTPVFGIVPIDPDTQGVSGDPDPDYCQDYGPCSVGQGDCDPGQCGAGLVCVDDVGAKYGLPAHYDVCEAAPGGDPDYCQDYGPCSVGQGDCDPGQCGAGLVCVDDVGAKYGLPAHYDVCEAAPGGDPDPDYCQDFGPCSAGQGDCDPGQCGAGLVCVDDVGAKYGLPAHYDVCEAAPGGDPDPDYCQDFGPCSAGQGDCDPGQCGAGLVCVDDVGAKYGLPAHYDVCEARGSRPDPDYCVYNDCSAGQGDCDPGQCASGLVCVDDVGAQYGLPAHYDVCEAAPGGDPDYCQDFGPCSAGQGDCDPGQCASGLVCVDDVGAQYGLPAHYDVCEAAPANILFEDDMENGVNGWDPAPPHWELTTASSRSGTHAWTNNRFDVLYSPRIDLTEVSSATLTFWHRYDFGSGNAGGIVVAHAGESHTLYQTSGTETMWHKVVIDLTPFVGQTILFSFQIHSDVGGTADGWYIDDVVVSSSDFETPAPDPDYCQDYGPCSAGQGDCDPGQCASGLVCVNDVGAQYGLPAHYDVCEVPSGGSG